MFLQPIMFPPTLSSQYTVSLTLWSQSSRWHEHCTFITFVWSDSGLTDFVLTLIRDGRGSIDIILHQERCEVRTLFITLNPLSALSDSLALTVWVTLTSILSNIFWAIHLPSSAVQKWWWWWRGVAGSRARVRWGWVNTQTWESFILIWVQQDIGLQGGNDLWWCWQQWSPHPCSQRF